MILGAFFVLWGTAVPVTLMAMWERPGSGCEEKSLENHHQIRSLSLQSI